MKLLVRVMEARNLRAMDLNGTSDPYVRLQFGKHKFKTKVVKKSLNPSWGEEFTFKVKSPKEEELIVSVIDEDKFFNDEYVGQLKLPISKVFDAENKLLESTWFCLQPKNNKSKSRECGEILLTLSISENKSCLGQTAQTSSSSRDNLVDMENYTDSTSDSSSVSLRSYLNSSAKVSSSIRNDAAAAKAMKSFSNTFAGRLVQLFHKNGEMAALTSRGSVGSDLSSGASVVSETPGPEVFENILEEEPTDTFEEVIRLMESKDQGEEVPSNLPGGVVLDQSYVVAPPDLNSLLFSPDSSFTKSMAELQGATELQQGPWKFENGCKRLKRVVTSMKAATRLMKAAKAIEEHIYLKADGKNYAVLVSISIPDVMYGSTFKTEIQFCITPGPELPSGEQSSRLVVSWRMNFVQSTMMRGMIEAGARQGLKDSFKQFAEMLSKNVKVVDMKDLGSNKEQGLASLQVEPQSDWKLATQYFLNFTVFSTVFMGLYVLIHILLAMPSTIQGLEFEGLDLPDSIGEVIVCGILVLQGKVVLRMLIRFMQARMQKGGDHGVKAQGDGWLLTVALLEGSCLAAVDSTNFSDPYVVFTCNGKTRTSSIKFQKPDPQWNEIFEFDAMNDPPSMLHVEVFDFDGPFNEATSLGHAEINFLKSNLSDLADVWIPLHGKLAQACQSKLHLRIYLNNTRGSNIVKEYLAKMEKEVGKKINVRSPQTNSMFQKVFGLPPEEFLINDFTCHLKRKLPLQGRLFLSARIIGFHTNMFGTKTTFFFLWEDIDDIHVLPPTLSSMGSPSIIITLRKGRGMDARHGAKIQDEEGRLKFHFQSFVSHNAAHRTIMALWKARSLSPEQKVLIVEKESGGRSLRSDESGCFLGVEDASMSELYSSVLSVPMNFFMEAFDGGYLDRKVMEKVGCLDYSHTPWEVVKPEIHQRQIQYKFDKHVSCYGGEVISTQQKFPYSDKNGWVVEEVMAFNGVPLGDYFIVHIRYQIEDIPSPSKSSKHCQVHVLFGIAWVKSTKHRKRITKNIKSNLTEHVAAKFGQVEREFTL